MKKKEEIKIISPARWNSEIILMDVETLDGRRAIADPDYIFTEEGQMKIGLYFKKDIDRNDFHPHITPMTEIIFQKKDQFLLKEILAKRLLRSGIFWRMRSDMIRENLPAGEKIKFEKLKLTTIAWEEVNKSKN